MNPGDQDHRGGHAAMPAELGAILAEIVPPGGSFGHREHVHLAFIAVRRHGPQRAAAKAGWLEPDLAAFPWRAVS